MEKLYTPFAKDIDLNCPLPEYPRPQMVRDSYVNLNGLWDYAIQKSDLPFKEYQGKILVPFSPECVLSGVNRILQPDETLYYRTTFSMEKPADKEVLLHFGAVDYRAEVFLNGKKIGEHAGGYLPFDFPVAEYLVDGENVLTLSVTDPTDTAPQSRGKQKLKRGGIFYTPQSGIWQTVWMEVVPKNYITSFRLIPDVDNDTLTVTVNANDGTSPYGTVTAFDGENVMASGNFYGGKCTLHLTNYRRWSPENPKLYDLKITMGEDEVKSYFGMRKFGTAPDAKGVMRLTLNNKPYFHNGLLDQGYWSDGMYTPPTDSAMIYDVEFTKKSGFNMLRKHIKIEPLRWYYHCDRMGILVWQDMVNGGGACNTPLNGVCGFLGIAPKDSDYKLCNRTDEEGRNEYYRDTEETVRLLYNCVSLCLWVPFNESWGQFDALKACDFVRNLDDTRPIDHASGWHDQGGGDFKSLHIYFRPITVPRHEKRTVVLSEFGGYSTNVKGHIFNLDHTFGYRKYLDLPSFEKAYKRLFEKTIAPLIPKGLSATVYTQLTDVEDEINGLITYDRAVEKISPETLKAVNEKIKL